MAAEKLRLIDQARAVCPSDSPVCVMPTASNCQRLGSIRRMTIRESPMVLGFFAVTYLRSIPGARVFQSAAGGTGKSDDRPRNRVAMSRLALRSGWEGTAERSVAIDNRKLEIQDLGRGL